MGYQSKFKGSEIDSLLEQVKDGGLISLDEQLSETSENAVMNKAVTIELNNMWRIVSENDFSNDFSNDFAK